MYVNLMYEHMSQPDIPGDVDFVRMFYVGNDGVVRGYIVPADRIKSVAENGMNLANAMQSFMSLDDLSPTSYYGPDGAVRLMPDMSTFRSLPYEPRTGSVMCNIENHEQEPWSADPRSTAQTFLAELDVNVNAAFESEFYLLEQGDDPDPIDDSVCFDPAGMQHASNVVYEIVDALEAQGMDFVTYYPEYGPGQQEVVVSHDEGITAADNLIRLKNTVKGVAINNELDTTFLPIPFEGAAGSGCHIHLSLWDDGENLFHDPQEDEPYQISRTARHFIGGILEHAPALVALTAPSVSSYRRLRPHMWASSHTCWGFDNREALVRVPFAEHSDPEDTTRIEFKAGDNTANPYLALLGVVAAGMDGIDRELDPGKPVKTDPMELSESERENRDITRLPKTLGEAVNELESSTFFAEVFGEDLFESYVDVKQAQWNEFTGETTEWELTNLRRSF